MALIWTNVQEIAEQLAELHSEVDPLSIRFTDLHAWICALPDFSDDPKASNERILEAIQQAWINELD